MTTTSPAFAPDAGKTPEQLCAERSRRLLDATEMKQPDRVPIMVRFGYMLAELAGETRLAMYQNPQKAADALLQAARYFQPDTAGGYFGTPGPSQVLGDRMSRWPGYGLDENGSFQFVEREYMKVEDYDDLIADPTDWTLRVYLPRTFSELEGLAEMQPLSMALAGYWGLVFGLPVFNTPPLARALKALGQAMQLQGEWIAQQIALAERMAAAGFPSFNLQDCALQAPFDFLSDALRGMRGIFSDMHRCPDKLLEAGAKMARLQLQPAFKVRRNTPADRKVYSFTATHRGSDEFISLRQFERFYWAQFKQMLLDAIEAGITPYVFWEGTWNQRLKYLAELPKGKTIGYFHNTDLFKAKDIIGDTMCIMGGMPVSLLAGGTVQEIRTHTKRLCEVVGKGGGFIMTTSTGELEGCKPELVKAWIDATKEFGTY
jgi:hypothetical protein